MDTVIKKFETFIIGDENVSYERYVFNRRDQNESEPFDKYLTELCHLAKNWEFCDCLRDSLIRDRIVMGIRDCATSRKLLQEINLTLNLCIDICHRMEATASRMREIGGPSSATASVEKVNKFGSKKPVQEKSKAREKPKKDCFWHGRANHTPEECLFKNKTCHACGKVGHIKPVCKLIKKSSKDSDPENKQVHFAEGDFSDSDICENYSLY